MKDKMHRLTQKDEQGNWMLKGVIWNQLLVGQTITKEVSERLYGALFKLMKYEDTGLSPDEIMDGQMLTGWIPVDEQLPDDPGDYWVTIKHLEGELTTEKMFWSPGVPYEDAWREVVVAWQPYYCPEPYKP